MFPTEKVISRIAKKFLDEGTWLTIGEGALKIIAIMVISGIVTRLGKIAIHNTFKLRNSSLLRTSERREATLEKLIDSILSYVVYFISFLMILSVLTIDVKALLAGAGIVGLAVGFGAQVLALDFLYRSGRDEA
jgi:small conductance mechanosensitive channel